MKQTLLSTDFSFPVKDADMKTLVSAPYIEE